MLPLNKRGFDDDCRNDDDDECDGRGRGGHGDALGGCELLLRMGSVKEEPLEEAMIRRFGRRTGGNKPLLMMPPPEHAFAAAAAAAAADNPQQQEAAASISQSSLFLRRFLYHFPALILPLNPLDIVPRERDFESLYFLISSFFFLGYDFSLILPSVESSLW